MIAPNQSYPVWIPHLQAQQQEERFEGIESAVDEIAHEEIIRIWHIASYAEELHQIVELPVDVTAYRDGCVDSNDISLFNQEFAGLVAEFADLGFWDRPARAQLRDGSCTEVSMMTCDTGAAFAYQGLLVEVTHRRADEKGLKSVHMSDCGRACSKLRRSGRLLSS